jgi:hypothetical protein
LFVWVAAFENYFLLLFFSFSASGVVSVNSISVPIHKTLFFVHFGLFLPGTLFNFDTNGVRFRTLPDSFQVNLKFIYSLLKITLRVTQECVYLIVKIKRYSAVLLCIVQLPISGRALPGVPYRSISIN